MNPEALAQDAARLVDTLEREQLKRLDELLEVVENDARARLSALNLQDRRPRAFAEQAAREALNQSRAARTLLELPDGPLGQRMRTDIQAAYEDGMRTAREAISAAAGETTDPEVLRQVSRSFGTRVDLPLIQATTESTLTTLRKVGEAGLDRLEEELVRASVRGAGPRAAARGVRDAVSVTRAEAERITRTVLMRTNNDARSQSFREAGIEYVRFDATNDSRTCEYCAGRHGFVYERVNAPETPLHPNCRCVLLPYQREASPTDRGDDYYKETRAELREREEITTRAVGSTRRVSGRRENDVARVTKRAPFERLEDRDAPRPAFRPD
ncbi:MAG: minor capsid protein, partial [Trueperaceae bacterium]|nr:minor capsid protein [Trueperaceae bacterium]